MYCTGRKANCVHYTVDVAKTKGIDQIADLHLPFFLRGGGS